MPYDIDRIDWKPGDVVYAAQLQAIVDELRRPSTVVRGGEGISVREGARGQVQATFDLPTGRSPGLITASFTPRSGTKAGKGTVALLVKDASDNLVDSGISVAAHTFAAASPSFQAGKYCWVAQDENGDWWLVSAEC